MRKIPTETTAAAAVLAADYPDKEKPSLKARAIDEAKKFLVMTLYLWLFLALLNLHKTAILQQNHIDYQQQGFALVNALVLAKVMLVADDLKLGTRFLHNPLIYHVLYTSFVFTVVLIGFYIIEDAAVALLRGRPAAEALAEFGKGNLRGVLSYGAIAFVSLTPFFLFRAIARAVGERQLWQLVFSREKRTFTLVAQE